MSDTKLKSEAVDKKSGLPKIITRQRMESLGLIHGLAFITLLTGSIFLISVGLYFRSDRSKYDLYRPGHSSVEEQNTETTYTETPTDSSLDQPVYKDEIDNLNEELQAAVADQSSKSAFKDENLSDDSILPPNLNINQ